MVSIHKYGTDRNNFVLHQHKGRFHTLHICKLYLDATLILSLSYNADSKHKVFSCLSLMDLPDKYGQVCDNSSLYLTVVVILLPLKNFCIVQDFQSLKENEVLHLSNFFYLLFCYNKWILILPIIVSTFIFVLTNNEMISFIVKLQLVNLANYCIYEVLVYHTNLQ